MKIKFFSAFLACAFLSVVGVSTVGCASDKNNSGNQAIVEYSKPVHVSRSVKSQRVYAASANEKTRAGVIKPYSTNTSSVSKLFPFSLYARGNQYIFHMCLVSFLAIK